MPPRNRGILRTGKPTRRLVAVHRKGQRTLPNSLAGITLYDVTTGRKVVPTDYAEGMRIIHQLQNQNFLRRDIDTVTTRNINSLF